jgi:hypothetical protein
MHLHSYSHSPLRGVAPSTGLFAAWKAFYGHSWVIKTYYVVRYIMLQIVVCNSDMDAYRQVLISVQSVYIQYSSD